MGSSSSRSSSQDIESTKKELYKAIVDNKWYSFGRKGNLKKVKSLIKQHPNLLRLVNMLTVGLLTILLKSVYDIGPICILERKWADGAIGS